MTLKILANNLLDIRRKAGLSRQQIERQIALSAHTIKAWESGSSEPGFIKLTAYLKYFENYNIYVSIKSLLMEPITLDNPLSNEHNLTYSKNEKLISDTTNHAINLLLEEKEEQLQALLNHSPFKIYLKDDKNNIIRVNNNSIRSINGVASDFEGKNVYDLYPAKEANEYHQLDLKALTTNKTIISKYEIPKTDYNPQQFIETYTIPIIGKNNKRIILGIWNNAN